MTPVNYQNKRKVKKKPTFIDDAPLPQPVHCLPQNIVDLPVNVDRYMYWADYSHPSGIWTLVSVQQTLVVTD